MTTLVLGPLLRYVSETEATVWVETSGPCEVDILGRREPTFSVAGHHYALVRIEGLEPGGFYEYEVALDGECRWPAPDHDLPPSAIRTLPPGKALDVCFGSCRVAVPHEPPYTETKDQDPEGRELDALHVLATQMARGDRDEWPELLFLIGDQIYVDEGSPRTREKIRARRDTSEPPGEEVVDFEEYSWLYEESWSDPMIRWLFSTVSISMAWDDHDMSDDWNISRSWHEEMDRKDWWHERAVDGIASYWIYQHLGNPSPRELDDNELYAKVRGNADATGVLRGWAKEIDTTAAGTRWSFCRDIDGVRAVFIDSRAARVLTDERRSIFDEDTWDWIVDQVSGTSTTSSSPPLSPTSSPPASTTWRPGTSDCAMAPGVAWPRAAARSCAAPLTSTTGPPSSSPSSACASCSKRSAQAAAARHRPRSSCSPATSTTPTYATSPSSLTRACRVPSTKRSARPTATRSRRRSERS
jgi:PhoD-like phosphatase